MKPVQFLLSVVAAVVLLAGCKNVSYKKTPGGMPYKIFKGNDTLAVKPGDIVKVLLTQKIKDSVYFTTDNGMPLYLPIRGSQPYDLSEVWTSLKRGDSIITTQMMDTFIARNPQGVPPNLKKGDRVMTYVKILNIFANDSLKTIDETKERDAFVKNEAVVIEKFLKDKNITAQKTPSGAYVEMKTPGAGDNVPAGKYVTVNYTGTSWSGKKFDSNIDSAFGHVGPMGFVAGTAGQPGGMIKGFDEAVMMMKPGSSAKVYIPSMLAYGQAPQSPDIKPYEHLIFDITVVDVKDKAPEAKKMPPPPPPSMPQQ
jgi:FKBP-type peptidyl-prolyl cis-trans isomerase FkpA